MERFGSGYLEERKLVQRWPQPIPALVALVLSLVVFYITWWIFQDPRGWLRMYTPYVGYMYTRWWLIMLIWMVYIFNYWPFKRVWLERTHPLIKGAVLTAISVVMPSSMTSIYNPGPHGLTEVTYAFTSASNNNGSAFAGFNGNTTWYNTTLGICMLFGRFALMVPILAIAGSLGHKQRIPASAGTLPTGTPLFALMVAGIAVLIVGLTYFPVLALGPIVEHLVGKF